MCAGVQIGWAIRAEFAVDQVEDGTAEYIDQTHIYIIDKVAENLPFPRQQLVRYRQTIILHAKQLI